MAALGSVRPQQGRARPQALRQPARRRSADGDPARARRLHAAPGRHQHLGGALRPDRRQRPGATRPRTSIRWKTRSIAIRPSTSCPSRSTTCERPTMQASIHVSREPSVQYLLRIGDTCLILAQRLAEWCGHAPIARGRHRPHEHGARPGRPGAGGADPRRRARGRARRRAHDEDQLAFLRDERDFRNLTLVELPRGDFAVTMLRNFAARDLPQAALASARALDRRRARRRSPARR